MSSTLLTSLAITTYFQALSHKCQKLILLSERHSEVIYKLTSSDWALCGINEKKYSKLLIVSNFMLNSYLCSTVFS